MSPAFAFVFGVPTWDLVSFIVCFFYYIFSVLLLYITLSCTYPQGNEQEILVSVSSSALQADAFAPQKP